MSSATGTSNERKLRIALGLNLAIVVVQVVVGVIAASLGLLADAAHNLTDVAAIVVSLIAVRVARRRADAPAIGRSGLEWIGVAEPRRAGSGAAAP